MAYGPIKGLCLQGCQGPAPGSSLELK